MLCSEASQKFKNRLTAQQKYVSHTWFTDNHQNAVHSWLEMAARARPGAAEYSKRAARARPGAAEYSKSVARVCPGAAVLDGCRSSLPRNRRMLDRCRSSHPGGAECSKSAARAHSREVRSFLAFGMAVRKVLPPVRLVSGSAFARLHFASCMLCTGSH